MVPFQWSVERLEPPPGNAPVEIQVLNVMSTPFLTRGATAFKPLLRYKIGSAHHLGTKKFNGHAGDFFYTIDLTGIQSQFGNVPAVYSI